MKNLVIAGAVALGITFASPVLSPQGTLVGDVVAPAAEACGYRGCERARLQVRTQRVKRRVVKRRTTHRSRPRVASSYRL